MELKAKKRKKNSIRVKKLVLWLKFLTISALFIAAVAFTALSPLFDLKAIEVKGNVHYNKEFLSGLADIQMGENGFKAIGSSPLNIIRFRFGAAEAAIRSNSPYVKDVRVGYAIPSTVVIEVTERTAAAVVPYMGTSLLIDREGYVLESIAAGEKIILPVINGLELTEYELGKKLNIKNSGALENGMKLLDAVKDSDKTDKTQMYGIINAVDAGDGENMKLLLDSRVWVNLGDLQDLNYRISTAKAIFNKNIKKGEKGTLDFTTGENPVFSPDGGGKY